MHLRAVMESRGAWGSLSSGFTVWNSAGINKCINNNVDIGGELLVNREVVNEAASDRSSVGGCCLGK